MNLEKNLNILQNIFLKILSQPKLVLGGDRGLFKIIKDLRF